MYKAFKMFDDDGGGSISIDEIKDKLFYGQNIDQSVFELIIGEIDDNGDGELELNEFTEMMQKLMKFKEDKIEVKRRKSLFNLKT